MTKDEAIAIARENAAWDFFEIASTNHGDINHLVDLMLSVADFEIEACAKICDAQASEPECPERAKYCADAIRYRKSLNTNRSKDRSIGK